MSDLQERIERALWCVREDASNLLSKWHDMSPEQRKELREIGMMLLTAEKKEAA